MPLFSGRACRGTPCCTSLRCSKINMQGGNLATPYRNGLGGAHPHDRRGAAGHAAAPKTDDKVPNGSNVQDELNAQTPNTQQQWLQHLSCANQICQHDTPRASKTPLQPQGTTLTPTTQHPLDAGGCRLFLPDKSHSALCAVKCSLLLAESAFPTLSGHLQAQGWRPGNLQRQY